MILRSLRTFGTGEATASRTALLASLLLHRARGGRTVQAAKVAKRLNQRGLITAAEVLAVAGANPTLVTVAGSTMTLTAAGHRAARSRPQSRWGVH